VSPASEAVFIPHTVGYLEPFAPPANNEAESASSKASSAVEPDPSSASVLSPPLAYVARIGVTVAALCDAPAQQGETTLHAHGVANAMSRFSLRDTSAFDARSIFEIADGSLPLPVHHAFTLSIHALSLHPATDANGHHHTENEEMKEAAVTANISVSSPTAVPLTDALFGGPRAPLERSHNPTTSAATPSRPNETLTFSMRAFLGSTYSDAPITSAPTTATSAAAPAGSQKGKPPKPLGALGKKSSLRNPFEDESSSSEDDEGSAEESGKDGKRRSSTNADLDVEDDDDGESAGVVYVQELLTSYLPYPLKIKRYALTAPPTSGWSVIQDGSRFLLGSVVLPDMLQTNVSPRAASSVSVFNQIAHPSADKAGTRPVVLAFAYKFRRTISASNAITGRFVLDYELPAAARSPAQAAAIPSTLDGISHLVTTQQELGPETEEFTYFEASPISSA
jgi:hypothetical protein